MKFLKIAILFAAIATFIFACSADKTVTVTNNNSTNAATNSTNVAVNSAVNKPAAPPDELASTRKTYSEECAKCHKDSGMGGQVEIDGKNLKVPDFTSDKLKTNYDEADWIDVITNGEGSKMPAFGKKLNETEIKNLVKLIRKDFQGK
jgi:mono/diheme cytochrome c family protein